MLKIDWALAPVGADFQTIFGDDGGRDEPLIDGSIAEYSSSLSYGTKSFYFAEIGIWEVT